MTGVKNTFTSIGRRGIIWDQIGTLSKTIDRGSHWGTSQRGTCIGCIYIQYQIICIHFSLVLFIVSQLICIQSHLVFTQAELIYVQSSFKYLFMLYVFSSQFFFVNMSNVLCVTFRILLKFVLFEKNKRNNCMSYSNFL